MIAVVPVTSVLTVSREVLAQIEEDAALYGPLFDRLLAEALGGAS